MLKDYQKQKVKNVRNDTYTEAITIWELSKTPLYTDDAYDRVSISSSSRTFSGSVAWGRTFERNDSEGGNILVGDVTLVCDKNYESYFKKEDVYIVVNSVRLRSKRVTSILDTDEIVIYCERIE